MVPGSAGEGWHLRGGRRTFRVWGRRLCGDLYGADQGIPGGVPRHRLDASEDDGTDRKSTRLNSSHGYISYAVFCLKKKKINEVSPLYQNNFSTKLPYAG